jgi:NodT family efflux transporter outer membrane factor (OMF) lipoprotein
LIKTLTAFLAVVALLGGCATVGPDYETPEIKSPPDWHSAENGGLTKKASDPRELAKWWTTLNDPILSGLIERAAANNLDVKEAIARVNESRARLGIARASYFPTVDGSASGMVNRSSEDTGTGRETESYSAGLDASWEIDFFGGVRRSVESANATLAANEASLNDIMVTLLADIALNYIDVRTYQSRLATAEANLKAQEETYQLTKARYDAGFEDELAIQQAKYNIESTRSDMPTLRSGLEALLNRLAVLLGQSPGTLHIELAEYRPVPVPPTEVAVGVPADSLRRRPDIRKAERTLASQNSQIGVATAELYPKLTLGGSIGLDSLTAGGLLNTGHYSYRYGPRLSWAVFQAGAIRKNIAAQTAIKEQYLFQYESAILTALEDVENALTNFAQEQERRESLKKAAAAAEKAMSLAQDKFQEGLVDFGDVLEAQRSLLSFQDQLAQSNGAVTANLVSLYKALGGGWAPIAVTPESKIKDKPS